MKTNYNLMYNTDFYKIGHINQYPKGTENVYSVWAARNTKWANTKPNKVVHFGIKMYIQKLQEFSKWFFNLSKEQLELELQEYKSFLDLSLNANININHWKKLHELGYLPLKIKSVEECKEYDIQTPLVTIENTVSNFYWLTNFIETSISANLWLASNSATIAYNLREYLETVYKNHTEEEKSFIDFQCHDFSYRGMGGDESAIISGMGHLAFFSGSDTIPAIKRYKEIYGVHKGYSVTATEHSVMCAGGKETEKETYERLLNTYPTGILSIVSDTWDYFGVVNEILPQLKDKIMSRDGKLVIRPDSGNPKYIILQTLEDLEKHFDVIHDSTGLKMFNKIGLIYGDSMTLESVKDIMDTMISKGYSPLNIVFGIGSFTYQYNTRDNYSFAMKATSVVINGVEKDIVKDPKTDPNKKSLTGRFDNLEELETVFLNGDV